MNEERPVLSLRQMELYPWSFVTLIFRNSYVVAVSLLIDEDKFASRTHPGACRGRDYMVVESICFLFSYTVIGPEYTRIRSDNSV